jgi:Subtilase family/PatG C-terminal
MANHVLSVEQVGSRINRKSFDSLHQAADSALTRQAHTPWEDAAAATVAVAVIDGPYDTVALSGVLARAPINLGTGSCAIDPGSACDHGTFIMGLLGARLDAVVPGQCPEARLLHVPLFTDKGVPSASVAELADAFNLVVASGAEIINLSLGIIGDDGQPHPKLTAALDRVEAGGIIIVAAAGNFGHSAGGQILTHRATIPVAAVDATGKFISSSSLAPEIARRSVAVPGDDITGYGAGGKLIRMSGTSVAAALVTGIVAKVWSLRPDATRGDIFAAVAALQLKGAGVPPALDGAQLLQALDAVRNKPNPAAPLAAQLSCQTKSRYIGGKLIMESKYLGNSTIPMGSDSTMARPLSVMPAGEARECTCSGSGAATPAYEGGFVYAIGTVEVEYPNVAIEREMQALAQNLSIKVKPDPHLPMKIADDRRWQHALLSKNKKQTRYIARQLSWRLTIEDNPVFVLRTRDDDLDQLIDCLKRPKFSMQPGGEDKAGDATSFSSPEDLDVVVGIRGPQKADGIELFVDQIFTIEPDQLAPKREGRLYGYLAQLSDNFGLTDQERAYNFLAARYKLPYDKLEKELQGCELAEAPAHLSALSGPIGSNRVVDVILTFRGVQNMVERKYFLRVDVTHEFPMLVKGLTPYLDR